MMKLVATACLGLALVGGGVYAIGILVDRPPALRQGGVVSDSGAVWIACALVALTLLLTGSGFIRHAVVMRAAGRRPKRS
jgi:hypothetical protein